MLRELSGDAELVYVKVEEHVMCSYAAGWRNGFREWEVAHDAQQAMETLEVTGSPPARFADIRREAFERQQAEGSVPEVDHVFERR